ncbi:L-lysine dehydrogenase [Planococcus halocryophilus Or1]|uniref:L-lysine dehydrogenase n=1 Tax=Planococcus halocryophilus TaxID=1215089 RepID=A0A1C7DUG9_9BACL|nr:saccharopine dehydrogenase C-terminal domain-containing protein [Planococcus halocryophilus]ANU14843.1 L-lysine dehydrogenase [Planococcus halocryophilus]EMF45219.1 L-lysine dehydrogenase [Planococcus halocryophilus Or1]
MHIFVLGTGMIGTTVVTELAKYAGAEKVTAVDINQSSIDKCLAIAKSSRVFGKVAELATEKDIAEVLKGADIAIACLPHSLSVAAIKAAIASNCHLIDLVGSRFPEKMAMHQQAQQAGVLIVPGCGVAPGITNFLAAQGIELLDEAQEAVLACGGVPKYPDPPLGYQVVYRLESMLDLYTKPATIIQAGKIVELAPLSGLEEMSFPEPVGLCETVITDAHSTAFMLQGKVTNLVERTVRYPGHWNKMRVLSELGFLDDAQISIQDIAISPKSFAEKILAPKLSGHSIEDITVLKVEVSGMKQGIQKKHTWEMIDLYDHDRKITSMAKTTAIPAMLVAQWIADKKILETGVIPIENLIVRERFQPFLTELAHLGIEIGYKEEIFG